MNKRRFSVMRHIKVQAKWILALLVVLVALVPSFWLATLDLRSNARLTEEVERGLHSDATFFSKRLGELAEQILYDENVRGVLDQPGYVVSDPALPGRAFYEADVPYSVDGLVAYPFLIDLSDLSFFAGRSADHADEVGQVFRGVSFAPSEASPLESGLVEAPVGGSVVRGWAEGPYGAFAYFYRLDATARTVRGVKVDPAVFMTRAVPLAYERLQSAIEAQREEEGFPEEVFGFRLMTPDTTFVLSRIAAGLRRGNQQAIGIYERPFDLGGLFPGWTLQVRYFNDLKANPWRRHLTSIIPLLIVLVGVGITARMVMREAELNRVKSLFVSNVSHELKTPLTKIQFFNDLLRGLPPEASEKRSYYHRVIQQECERLAILVDNVLDLNRIERGQMSYQFSDVPVAEVVSEVVETFNVIYEARGYQVALRMEEGLPTMHVDPGAVKQALINLMDNAVKYSENPHTLQMRAEQRRWDGEPALLLSVQDQGMGIPKDKLPLIFEEFYRVDNNGARKVTGSGLGLPLVKHIVEAHGGTIRVESEESVGSTFTILLPVKAKKKVRSG